MGKFLKVILSTIFVAGGITALTTIFIVKKIDNAGDQLQDKIYDN